MTISKKGYLGLIFCHNLQTGAGAGPGHADPELIPTLFWRATTEEVEADLVALRNDLNPEVLVPKKITIVEHVWSFDL